MSHSSPVHQPAGTPTGGQFAPSARTEDPTVQLDGAQDPASAELIDAEMVDTDAQLPTDPMALIAALDAERARESAETYALQYEADQTLDKHVHVALEDAQTMSAEQEFRRYRLLANAVTGAAPTARGPYLVALIGQLDAERGWERDEVNALRDTTDASDDQADYEALENAEKRFSGHESVRYRLLAEAVIDAARPACNRSRFRGPPWTPPASATTGPRSPPRSPACRRTPRRCPTAEPHLIFTGRPYRAYTGHEQPEPSPSARRHTARRPIRP